MALILENRGLGDDFWLMRVEHPNAARPGQFYMLRAWETYPVLSRPVSVFDADPACLSFLYKVVGKGTALLAALRPGQSLTLDGPHGNTWPQVGGKVALVGGGVGIAPLYLAARALAGTADRVDLYLGFSGRPLLQEAYAAVGSSLTAQVGGFITDAVDPAAYDHLLACGPEAMMRALYEKCRARGAGGRLWVSVENRMACGLGACLVCTCKTRGGNRKACVDGPIFKGEEVYGL